MKEKTYSSSSSVAQLCMYLEQFDWFKQLDIYLCSLPLIELRMWWHELWVRSSPNHPSAKFDRQILDWYKMTHVLAWDMGKATPYEVNLVRRWRVYDLRFPPRRDEPIYPIRVTAETMNFRFARLYG